MNSQRSGVANEGEKGDYSFFEALTFESHEPSLNIKELGLPALPPTPISPTPRVSDKNNALQRTGTSSYNPPPKSTKTKTKSKMAPTKAQLQCFELCHKTTTSIDLISVRILEYLTTVKQLPYGFEPLAHDFLDTCQILFSIEAGLGECNRSAQSLPNDMITELDHKFRVTQADFSILNQMLAKMIAPSNRITRGWGKLFGDTDIKKMSIALAKTRESLRLSSLVFQWSMGNQATEKEKGIGYTGLAAALDRMDDKSGTTRYAKRANGHAVQQPSAPAPAPSQPLPPVPSFPIQAPFQIHSQSPSQTPSYPTSTRPISPAFPPGSMDNQNGFQQHQQHQQQPQSWAVRSSSVHQEGSAGKPSGNETRQPVNGALRAHASVPGTLSQDFRHSPAMHHPASGRTSTVESHDRYEQHSAMDDARSLTTITEPDVFRDHEDFAALELDPSKVTHLVADPSSMPRSHPRNSVEGDITTMRAALISAVRGKNHRLVEQLLHRGVPANTGPNMHALKEAVLAHDDDSIRLLLMFGADPNDPDRDGITPLSAAVETSFLPGATSLLKYGADPNLVAGPELESPLASAVEANVVNFSHLLLTYGGDANHMTVSGTPLLTSAIKKKTPKRLIDLLLEYGSGPNNKSTEGRTALFEAIQLGRADIVTSLLEHGADPNLPGPKHMLWPSVFQTSCLQILLSHGADHRKCPGLMELAVSVNNTEAVRTLLKAGVSPDTKKDGTYTPLCTAIRDDRADLVELLLSNGAGPNVMASEYPAFKCITHNRVHFLPALVAAGADLHSPKGIVEMAVSCDNVKALTWLLDQGVNPNDRNPKGMSPLTTAIRENRFEMLDQLLLHGADPHMRGEDWPVCMAVRNPVILKRILEVVSQPQAFKGIMEMAVSANQLESVKLLIAAGVSVEDKNGGVFSPLTTAIRENRREIVNYLLDFAGVDVNAPGEHLPIVKALRRYHGEDDTEIMETLLKHGADPNKMYRGWNGFMQGVENGEAEILRILTRHAGVDLEVKDDMGRTVVEMAASRGWDEAVQILTSEGEGLRLMK